MQQVGKAANTYGEPLLHSGCSPNSLTRLRRIRRRWIGPNLSKWRTGLPEAVGTPNVHVVAGVGQSTGVTRSKHVDSSVPNSPLLLVIMRQQQQQHSNNINPALLIG